MIHVVDFAFLEKRSGICELPFIALCEERISRLDE